MRRDIVHPGADELTYEIREIVAVGEELRALGVDIYWENIGDPVAKGHPVPDWIKTTVAEIARTEDAAWGYSPTKGIAATREFIADIRTQETEQTLAPADILFCNGLGDAIQTAFMYLHPATRVVGPNPAYPTHSSAEAAHAGSEHLTYNLLPEQGWLPDLDDIYQKVKYNPTIGGILIINPDNPTGIVYPESILRGIVDIAREFGLFIMSDEIYANVVYGDVPMTPLATVLGDVPGLAMRGLSKEVPWPGSRCGWLEFYNLGSDANFARYQKALVDAKQLEVCATTLPQAALPRILADARYPEHLTTTAARYRARAEELTAALADIPGLTMVPPQGAFYAAPVFSDGVLTRRQSLPIADDAVRAFIEARVANVAADKRFVYYLLAATGICVVPLSGMNSDRDGFRVTLLEPDDARFAHLCTTLAENIRAYLASA